MCLAQVSCEVAAEAGGASPSPTAKKKNGSKDPPLHQLQSPRIVQVDSPSTTLDQLQRPQIVQVDHPQHDAGIIHDHDRSDFSLFH